MKNIIIGAGAGGLFLAYLLKKDYLLLEHNSEIGKKIKISGGGKCNITNRYVTAENYRGDKKFITEALKHFDNRDLLKWLEKNHIFVKELKKGQYFFETSDVLLDFFKKNVKNIRLNTKVLGIDKNKVITSKGVFEAENIIIATGGVSYKSTGATSFAFDTAQKAGHTISPLKPALTGLTVQKEQAWFKQLSGVSFLADVYVQNRKYSQNILFSHRGISGPAILNASLRWDKGKIRIDFLAGKNIKTFLKNKNRQISTQLPLPKRFTKEFLKSINIEDKKIKQLTKEEFAKLQIINSYEFAPAGTFGFERAEVTKGGVLTDEIDEFMRSKIKNNIFFLGEALDVTGELGGYNFQWAFTSAFNAFRFLRR